MPACIVYNKPTPPLSQYLVLYLLSLHRSHRDSIQQKRKPKWLCLWVEWPGAYKKNMYIRRLKLRSVLMTPYIMTLKENSPNLPTTSKISGEFQQSFRNLMEPLLVLFNKAAGKVLKNKSFYISYSIPGGVFGYFTDHKVSGKELGQIYQQILVMIQNKESFTHEVLPLDQVINYFEANHRNDILHLIRSLHQRPQPEGLWLSHLNGCGELLINRINPNYDKLQNFKLTAFNHGFFLVADTGFFDRVMPPAHEQSKYLSGFEESEETMKHLGIASFAELNDIIREGRLSSFISLSETWQNRRISNITDRILSHPDRPRLIFLAGPTSSGKTTSAHRLAIELRVMKKQVMVLSLDNYYRPHCQIPDDPATGMKNFEVISALDLDLFKENISRLLAGKPVHLPTYHFDGKGPIPQKEATVISPDTFIIVEGIHGLNPELWQEALDMPSFRLYVSALSTLNIHDHLPVSTSDHRLIRRLVRDHLFRGYSFNETIRRWPDIIQNEYQYIFPHQESAHEIFNSALAYELAVFAHYSPEIVKAELAENDTIREEVRRLHRILSLLTPINPADIPPTSILREFIGGGSLASLHP